MNNQSTWLLDHKKDIYSQTGEDGIIEAILQILPHKDQWCVEFGAWDGLFSCNTRNLIDNKGYSSLLIEGDQKKSEALKKNFANNNRVITLNAYVGFTTQNNLETILKEQPIPNDFDLLSIDIDGNDYHVWKAMTNYRPKIVCIEFNPTIPTEVFFVQAADKRINQGASLKALVALGKDKGYELVSVLPFNAFFIDSQYYPLLGISDNEPEKMRVNKESITYLFSGYDGTVFLSGCKKLPWHQIALRESRMQPLHKFLRGYPFNYNKYQRKVFNLLRKYSLI